jgi:8-hydroxy-5-deazaflavin:NADPH oxidoreductase
VIIVGGGASAKDAAARQGAEAGSNSEAAGFGDVLILAVPFAAIDAALADAGPLRSRVLWSCVNALKRTSRGLAVGFDDSAAEEVARRAPPGPSRCGHSAFRERDCGPVPRLRR